MPNTPPHSPIKKIFDEFRCDPSARPTFFTYTKADATNIIFRSLTKLISSSTRQYHHRESIPLERSLEAQMRCEALRSRNWPRVPTTAHNPKFGRLPPVANSISDNTRRVGSHDSHLSLMILEIERNGRWLSPINLYRSTFHCCSHTYTLYEISAP